MDHSIEANYPISFRQDATKLLGTQLRENNSVVLIGMKRVGISNFLRFFLNHPEIPQKYLPTHQPIFIFIDLNNLVEKTLYAFWMLTLKRLVDCIEGQDFSKEVKQQAHHTFTQSIQLGDFFFTLEAVQKLLKLITDEGKYVSLFFLRFDRLQGVFTSEFLGNLQGVRDHAKNMSFVFTSYRPLHELVPTVFTRSEISVFLHDMYLKPASQADMRVILSTFQKRYNLALSTDQTEKLIELAGGHVQYLQLALIRLKNQPHSVHHEELQNMLLQDEEVRFLSEELYTSLTDAEQEVLIKVKNGSYSTNDETAAHYLWETGMIAGEKTHPHIFNTLFSAYLDTVMKNSRKTEQDFTKKEHLLFTLLQDHQGELVERDDIINHVWPDEAEFGVSDWSIDRLVARVRGKLKAQESEYKIVTVITRGYKLVKK